MRIPIALVGLSVALAGVLMVGAIARQQDSEGRSAPLSGFQAALETVTSEALLRHIKTLASDEFEGRAPGTRGEDLTVNYLIEQFKQFGLKAGNHDGAYIQKVPLVGIMAQPTASFAAGGKMIDLKFPDDYVAVSPRFVPEVAVNDSRMVFVGHGIVAPEYGWDDYKGADVKGKTILMLSGEPQIPDPSDPTKLDDKMFKGRAITPCGSPSAKSPLRRGRRQ
jgi:hypothetical protein